MLFFSIEVDKSNKHVCECGSTNIIEDSQRGDLICRSCGLVIDEHIIDPSGGKRFFNQEERNQRARTGSPLTNMLPDMGLTTTIDNFYHLPAKQRKKFYRLKKWQNRQTWHQKNLSIAMNEIRRLVSQLKLPSNVKEAVATLYRKVYNRDMIKGRSIESMAAGALYIVCRERNIPISIRRISELSKKSERSIRKAFVAILKEFNIKLQTVKPEHLLTRIGGELKISNDEQKEALSLLKKSEKSKIFMGKDPKGVAAAAIYLALLKKGNRISQRKVSEAAKVTEVTLRNRLKNFKNILN